MNESRSGLGLGPHHELMWVPTTKLSLVGSRLGLGRLGLHPHCYFVGPHREMRDGHVWVGSGSPTKAA
jgi:hypothetical protein